MVPSMQGLPLRNAVCPSPSIVIIRALPRSSVRRSAHLYGVAEAYRVPPVADTAPLRMLKVGGEEGRMIDHPIARLPHVILQG
jgi:hypothetical protein